MRDMGVLAEFLSELDVPDPEAVATAIRGRFRVIDREKKPQPEPAVGQVWRGRASGDLVRIDRITVDRVVDPIVEWTGLDDDPRGGAGLQHTWMRYYAFVAESEADL